MAVKNIQCAMFEQIRTHLQISHWGTLYKHSSQRCNGDTFYKLKKKKKNEQKKKKNWFVPFIKVVCSSS